MLRRVSMEGVPLPRLYIAENNSDIREARDAGIPYIKWTQGNEALVKLLLRPVLEKMFPHIKWNQVLGKKPSGRSLIVNCPGDVVEHEPVEIEIDPDFDNDARISEQFEIEEKGYDPDLEWKDNAGVADAKRSFSGGGGEPCYSYDRVSVWNYMEDASCCVDLDALQHLGLLPKFMGDIADCVKVNLSNRVRWTEGFNKKLGVPVGNFAASGELPNLIILDVSGSIPRGISATMLAMIDTLRSQVSADLIITGSNSGYYKMGTELPTPDQLRAAYRFGNECREFYAILNKYIAGRKWGHVISFGDNDAPQAFLNGWCNDDNEGDETLELTGTEVKAVHHYHTRYRDTQTGYAGWVHGLGCSPEEHYDTSWCNVIYHD